MELNASSSLLMQGYLSKIENYSTHEAKYLSSIQFTAS